MSTNQDLLDTIWGVVIIVGVAKNIAEQSNTPKVIAFRPIRFIRKAVDYCYPAIALLYCEIWISLRYGLVAGGVAAVVLAAIYVVYVFGQVYTEQQPETVYRRKTPYATFGPKIDPPHV